MTVLNGLDRYHLVQSVVERAPAARENGESLRQMMQATLLQHHDYIRAHGQDMPEVREWQWMSS